ncbi:Uncharacterised protein [Salmonella bongori]|nr:Uncharacterised protein [Salmonella bongori]
MTWWVSGLALLVSVTVFSFIGYFVFAVFIAPMSYLIIQFIAISWRAFSRIHD